MNEPQPRTRPHSRNARRLDPVPRGAYCAHDRMRRGKCSKTCVFLVKERALCMLRCPDCGFEWQLFEGELG